MKFTALILAASLAVSGAFVHHAPATARAGRFAVKAQAEKEPMAGLPQFEFDAKVAPATVATALSMVPAAAHAGVVPPQLSAMQDALRWCRKALGEVHAKSANGQPNPNHGIQPHDDCSTRLELGITTPFE